MNPWRTTHRVSDHLKRIGGHRVAEEPGLGVRRWGPNPGYVKGLLYFGAGPLLPRLCGWRGSLPEVLGGGGFPSSDRL